MKKTIASLILCAFAFAACAQTNAPKPAYVIPQYGIVDQADLELKSCDFEKDANAEVLFEKGNVYFADDLSSITSELQRRIKIFNDNGKDAANIKIVYYSGNHMEYITNVQAQTINVVNGKVEVTKLDKKLIYNKILDKYRSEITFSFPNVRAGSIIEFKYNFNASGFADMPDWYFQDKIPIRYSEYSTAIPDLFYFRAIPHLVSPLVKDEKSSGSKTLNRQGNIISYYVNNETRAMANIPSVPDEPYMSSYNDNVQSIRYQLVSIRPIYGMSESYSDTWNKVGATLAEDEDFGGQLKRKLNGEETIIAKAKTLKTDDQKIAYIFGEVKNTMKWNGNDHWYTIDGTPHSWDAKTGNSTEINLILYHLLKQTGINAYPMVVSTREHGKVDPFYTSLVQFNRAVVLVPVDSTKKYILDATGKYNIYNETPSELLNSLGLYIDKSKEIYKIIRIEKNEPVRQVIMIDAEIKPTGKIEGTAQINYTGYSRIDAIERYKKEGEKKYLDYLRNNDNDLNISTTKFENMEIDTLPLTQSVNFNLNLSGSDENYIYLNPNILTPLKSNPFLSDNRTTDIDFVYPRSYTLNSSYKIPAGFKTDALPKSVTLVMPDKSFSFRRLVIEQDGQIVIHYTVNYNVSEYSRDNYADFHEFFKKMHEMLNEQIVLKKS